MSRSNIKQIAKEKTAHRGPFIGFCTVLQTLQEVDLFLQQRWLHLAKTKLVEQSVDKVPAGVLAMIVEETTDPTLDPPQGVEVME